MKAIELIMKDCVKHLDSTLKNGKFAEMKFINIYTDSQFVLDLLSINGYPQSNYMYKLMNKINRFGWLLHRYNISINLIKLPSHSGIFGNQVADNLAKQAGIIAYNCKYRFDDTIRYNTYYNPIIVDISKDLIDLRKYHSKIRKQEWRKRNELFINKNEDSNIFFGDGIFHKYVVNSNGGEYTIRIKSKQLKNELKYLSRFESEIITKLRTEYINLNSYKSFRFNDTDGNCPYCGVNETVNHYLLDCPGNINIDNYNIVDGIKERNYNQCRNVMRKKLRHLAMFFRYENNFNSQNILFPSVWQHNPRKTNPNFKKIKRNNQYRITQTLKIIVKFVLDTQRFKYEKYKY